MNQQVPLVTTSSDKELLLSKEVGHSHSQAAWIPASQSPTHTCSGSPGFSHTVSVHSACYTRKCRDTFPTPTVTLGGHRSSPTKTPFHSKYPGAFKQVHSMQEIYPYPSVLVRPVDLRTTGYCSYPENPQLWGTKSSELQHSPPSVQLGT